MMYTRYATTRVVQQVPARHVLYGTTKSRQYPSAPSPAAVGIASDHGCGGSFGSGLSPTLSTCTGGTAIDPGCTGSTYTSTYSSIVACSLIGNACEVSRCQESCHHSQAFQTGSGPVDAAAISIHTWSPALTGYWS